MLKGKRRTQAPLQSQPPQHGSTASAAEYCLIPTTIIRAHLTKCLTQDADKHGNFIRTPRPHPLIEHPRTSSPTGHTKNPQHSISRKRKAPDLDPHLALTCVTCSLFRPPYEPGTGKEEVQLEHGPTPQQVLFTFASIELLRH